MSVVFLCAKSSQTYLIPPHSRLYKTLSSKIYQTITYSIDVLYFLLFTSNGFDVIAQIRDVQLILQQDYFEMY